MTELQALLKTITRELGDPTGWGGPVEFPDSLALCALNSAYSLRATSSSVGRVLARYRQLQSNADTDGGADLLRVMDGAGGPETFARQVLRNETVLPGTKRLRTVGIYEGLSRLATVGVTTAAQLREAAGGTAAERAWRSVHGFGPLAWSYLVMNAGVGSETKPDVMVQRFLTRSIGGDHELTPGQMRQLLTTSARELGVEPRQLDRAIWLHESPHG